MAVFCSRMVSQDKLDQPERLNPRADLSFADLCKSARLAPADGFSMKAKEDSPGTWTKRAPGQVVCFPGSP